MLEKIIQTAKLYSAAAVMALSIGACQKKPEAFGVYASDKETEISANKYHVFCSREDGECIEGILGFAGSLYPTFVSQPVFYAYLADSEDVKDFELWGPVDVARETGCYPIHLESGGWGIECKDDKRDCDSPKVYPLPSGHRERHCNYFYSSREKVYAAILPLEDGKIFKIEPLFKTERYSGAKICHHAPCFIFNPDKREAYLFQVK